MTASALAFHRKLDGYEPTPLIDARPLAERLGLAQVLVKSEASRFGLPSFKLLGAALATYRALDARFGPLEPWSSLAELEDKLAPARPLSLAAATDGNHGRAVAHMARNLGLPCRIFVPTGTARARIEAIESEGAAVEVVAGDYDDTIRRSAEEASTSCLVIDDTSWPGYEDVPRWVIEGYETIFHEIDDQTERRPDVVFVPLGVGALGAAAAGFYLDDPDVRVIGVEPDTAACVLLSLNAGKLVTVPGPHPSIMAGLNCGTPSPVAFPVLQRGLETVVTVRDEDAEDAMRALASCGIVSGETGAAALAGLMTCNRSSLGIESGARALVLCTEGATDPEAYERIVGRPASEVTR